ncbi:hypothetical protein [Actinopolymorpha pittospori]|uniref:Uncharacterized protein n=1 Tax=Actinopolymorpha pittospori TaxID=648752 RepID=A0A927RDD9_9ACTN|nr:hypothetical protein [Actinopolymorpha pittospori]MBE1612287.1 hypothetical protein [Actinopolymorpha pittospori]
MRRIAPAIGLFFLAPLIAEFLLGNLPVSLLFALMILAPLYGAGALLIREVVRRTGRGWPSIIVLGLAYAVFEEGVTTQSLFNPNYANAHLLDHGYVPALGLSVPWTLGVLALHAVWSIGVPIGLTESLVLDRPRTPWLGKLGLTVTAVLFALGSVATTAMQLYQDDFVASVPQFVGVAVAIVVFVAVAMTFRPAARQVDSVNRVDSNAIRVVTSRTAPNPWWVGAFAFVTGTAFRLLPDGIPAWLNVAGLLVLAAIVIAVVRHWSHQTGWGDSHRFALVAGAMVCYAVHSFIETPVMPVSPAIDHTGDVVFSLAALVTLALTARRLRRHAAASTVEEAGVAPARR